MGNVLAAHMKNTGENADFNWNNNTLLGEFIEKALLKNTKAQKEYEKNVLGKSEPTDYNSVLIKRACCLGIPYDDKKPHDTLPVVNVPIANIGYNSTGLPDKDGKFNVVEDHTTLFDELPLKDKTNKFNIKPKDSKWFETQPINEDRKNTFNSGGMIIKKLRFKNNKGEKLLTPEQCNMKRESWESVTDNNVRKYEAYNKTGVQGKVYDVTTGTDVCDAFYQYYGKNQVNNRQCVIPDPENPGNDIINSKQPGCGETIEDPNDNESSKSYFYTDKGQNLTFTPQYHYPNDLACINSPYGSVYTDEGGRNPYRAGSVYPVDFTLANPIGIDMRCSGNVNEPVQWGEAYTTTNYRKEANSTKCVNAVVFNNIKADNVNVSDINQTNDCDTTDVPPSQPEPPDDTPIDDGEDENTDEIVERSEAERQAARDANSRKFAQDNAEEERKEQQEIREAAQKAEETELTEKNDLMNFLQKNMLFVGGGVAIFMCICILFIFLMMRR